MARNDASQMLYNNFMKNAEANFGASCKLECLHNLIATKKLFLKGFVADEAMVFTNDSFLRDKLIMQEINRSKRNKKILPDGGGSFCRVIDIGDFINMGFKIKEELPSPYNNVAIVGEGDKYDQNGKVLHRGKRVMVCTHDPSRLKVFVNDAIRGIANGTSKVGYMQLSLNNQMITCDHDDLSRYMEFDKFIDKWTSNHPTKSEYEY